MAESQHSATGVATSTPSDFAPATQVPAGGRARGRRWRPWVWISVVIVVTASFGTYYYLASQSSVCAGGPHTLVVDTYASFLDSGTNPNTTRAAFVNGFQNLTGARLCLAPVSGDLATSLLTQRSGLPDVVVGLDEITAPRVDARGLLVPYTSPLLTEIPRSVVNAISADGAATPYEFGFLGLDYNLSFDAANGHAFSAGNFLTEVQTNSSLARSFLYETPTTDITGEEFLVMQIEFATHLLRQNWTQFWRAIGPLAPTAPDWATGFTEFSHGIYPTCVSYTTDPAYNAYSGAPGAMNASVLPWQGANYSWETVYGAGIVRGGVHNLTLAERFVDYLLSASVQSLLPLNEWEYPAVADTPLPAVYATAVPPSSIRVLNAFTTPNATAAALPGWLLEWQSAVGG